VLIFLDTETTGLEELDRICSLGVIIQDSKNISTHYELIKSSKKIKPEASAVHHLTDEMLKDKKVFKKSKIYKTLQECNSRENVLISHNINFDLKMLQKEGFIWEGAVIDTLKCVRHLIPECEQFSLQYLRYELRLYKEEKSELDITIQAHNALSDALHVRLLYKYLLDYASHEKLEELSMKNVLISKFAFGKYKGRYIEDIAMSDRAYIEWMLNTVADMDEDLLYSLEYYLSC
jgi:DNA polymerase-3 subunit epsilon/exodeoxyribonuclease X